MNVFFAHFKFIIVITCCFFAIFFGTLFVTSDLFASFITMDVNVSTTVQAGEIEVYCTVINRGDEPANDVKIDALFKDRTISSPSVSTLGPGETTRQIFRSSMTKGFLRTIVPLVIHYKDVNGYLFSALSYADAKLRETSTSPIFGKVEPLTIARRGTLIIKLKSLDGQAHQVSVRLAVPNELTVTPLAQEIGIPASGESTARFKLSNFSAFVDSNYMILGILSEQRSSGLYENVLLGRVNIVAPESIPGLLSSKLFIPLLGLLILAYVLCQIPKWKQRKDE